MKNATKSPKRTKNNGNASQQQTDQQKRSPYLQRTENQENKSPSNRRGMYNFKRYTHEENGFAEVPVFITRDQMGNFLTPQTPNKNETKRTETSASATTQPQTLPQKDQEEQKVVWKLPIVTPIEEKPPQTRPQANNNKNNNKGDKKKRKKDE